MNKEEINKSDKTKDNQENKSDDLSNENKVSNKELSTEEKIKNLEDKITRTLAEMENQRRRFEKEKNDAFEYGGFAFAKEALNLIDNLARSKLILENDEKLKETESLKKNFKSSRYN